VREFIIAAVLAACFLPLAFPPQEDAKAPEVKQPPVVVADVEPVPAVVELPAVEPEPEPHPAIEPKATEKPKAIQVVTYRPRYVAQPPKRQATPRYYRRPLRRFFGR
jgi:protein TonB